MSETPESLAAALVALQAKLPKIAKSERADVVTKQGSYSYTYAGLADISDQVLPLLSGVGLSFTAKPGFVDGKYVLICSLLHVSGEREEGYYPLPTSGTPQAIGSQITYGRRYTLCAMTGIAPEDDDDGAAAEAEQQANRGTAQRGSRPRQQRQEPRQTAQRGTRAPASAPPLPTEQQPDDQPDMITQAQQARIGALMRDAGITSREDALDRVAEVIGRRVESRTELTLGEAGQVVEALDPPAETDDQ